MSFGKREGERGNKGREKKIQKRKISLAFHAASLNLTFSVSASRNLSIAMHEKKRFPATLTRSASTTIIFSCLRRRE